VRQRFLVICNPRAGWWGRRHYDGALGFLRDAGAHVDVVETGAFSQGRQLAHAAANAAATASGTYDAVIAAGGDGTIHDVASGLVGGNIPLGIIPTGTGNVFARELAIKQSAAALGEMLLWGEVVDMPLGLVAGRPFLFVIGIGFDAKAVHHFEKAPARHLGRAGFVMPVLRALAAHGAGELTVSTAQKVLRAHWVIVTRVKHYAAGLMLAPGAEPLAREFHVICFRGAGAMIRLRQLSALASGLGGHDPGIEIIRTTQALIAGAPSVPVQIDGEVMGRLPLEVSIHPETLPIILPSGP